MGKMETMVKSIKPAKAPRYVYKNMPLSALVDKVKLWPSRNGILHGVKTVEYNGNMITVTTHCNETFSCWDSKTSRSARWLRNRWCLKACPRCKVPQWKLEKYSSTVFTDSKKASYKR